MKQTKKIISISLTFLLTIYLAVILFPRVIFSNKLDYKSFTIYSHYQLDKNIFLVLDSADNIIRQSELYGNNSAKRKIYLCKSFFEYAFFAPTQRYAFACTNPLTNNILLSKCNVLLNKIVRNGYENNIRTLSGTVAHEVIHTLIKNKIGFIKYIQLDTWKTEGYCDFIANESSFNSSAGMQSLCKHQSVSSPSFQYFKYRLYITYLMNDKHLSFNEIIHDKFNEAELDEILKRKYCR